MAKREIPLFVFDKNRGIHKVNVTSLYVLILTIPLLLVLIM